MGKIKKITENELVGGTQNTDVYPVTSVKAVYDENNERLDHILNRRGVVNISTNYNADHIAEILTLEQAIAKVPSKDRVLGFQGRFLSENGWKSYVFIGDSIADWTNKTKWNNYLTGTDIVQESGEAEGKVMSQKAVSDKLSELEDKKADAKQVNSSLYDLEKKIGDRFVVEGNVTNLPDEEDLTSVKEPEHDVLKLADRNYAPYNFSGKGYKILRKNIESVSSDIIDNAKQENRNIITAAMINQPNTIYEIRYDFDLNGETIEMQEGCILKFEGGSLKNGKIVGNSTVIKSSPVQIFKNISILGSWNCISYPEWFDNIQSIFDKSTFSNIRFVNTYILKKPIIISRDNINIDGGGRFITESTNVFHILNCSNINISSLSFSALAASDSAIFCKVVNNIKITKCSCENINLFSSASGTNDNYNTTTKENSNNYIVISNNNGINTNPKITNQAIRLIFVNNFSVVGNNFDGYYNGILAWGGDAAHVCQTLSEDRKCKDGIIANNVFTNCLSAGIWTGCAQRVTLTNNLVTSNMNSSNEGLDAEGSIDILFDGNIVRGFASGCCLFGNVDNIIFKNNDIELNDNEGYTLLYESRGITDITKKNGIVKLEGNRIFSTSTKYFYYTGKALICINNTLYNPVDNSGLSGGYGYFCNNRVIYNVNWSQRHGMLRTMYLRPIDGVKENFYNVIGNEFISECDDIDYYPMMLTAQDLENASLSISNNKFLNFQECLRAYSDALVKTYITFENNIFDNKTEYPILSPLLQNTLLLWNNNIFTTGKPIENKLFANLTNLYVKTGSRIALYKNDDGYTSDVMVAMKDGRLVDKSIYNRNVLQTIPRFVNKTSELPSLIYSERGMTIFDTSTNQLLIWNGSSWRRDGGGSTDKQYGIDVNLQNEPIGSMFFRTDLHKPIFNDRERGYYVDSDGNRFDLSREGTSNNRPSNVNFGFIYKDTTLGKLIIWDGSNWVNMDGTEL